MSISLLGTVDRIEIFTQWFGFYPPARVAKLVLTRAGDRFQREASPEGGTDELPPQPVIELLNALTSPPVPQLEPSRFPSPSAIERHYDSFWTNDSPQLLVRIGLATGRIVEIRSDRQYAFMLPLRVSEGDSNYETFDPRLSQAIAGLMPEGHLERDRLLGNHGFLELEAEERPLPTPEPEPLPEPPPAGQNPETVMDEIIRILSGEESPDEKALAESEGRLSERLLRRISVEDVRDLLARGADPNVSDDVGQTALMHAAFPPFDAEKFRLLVEAGAEVDARRNDGGTGLHNACAGWEVRAAQEWLRAGANINARTPEGTTPLMLAVGSPELVRFLLTAGAEVNAVDQDGHSALVYAILARYGVVEESVSMLIEAGIDTALKDREGLTALDHARRVVSRTNLEEEFWRNFHGNEPAYTSEKRSLAEAVVEQLGARRMSSRNPLPGE